MRHVDNAHLDLSANRPPFHTPGKMIEYISINREKVEWSNGHDKDRQTGISAKKGFLAMDVIAPGTKF